MDPKRRNRGDAIEVAVSVEDLRIRLDALRGEDAVDRAPDRASTPSSHAEQFGCPPIGAEGRFPEERQREQAPLDASAFYVGPNSLQHLADDELRRRKSGRIFEKRVHGLL